MGLSYAGSSCGAGASDRSSSFSPFFFHLLILTAETIRATKERTTTTMSATPIAMM